MTLKLLFAASLVLGLATPALACDMHKSHAALTTAAAAPTTVVPQAGEALPQSAVTEEAAISVPEDTATSPAYGGCRRDKKSTVYLTN